MREVSQFDRMVARFLNVVSNFGIGVGVVMVIGVLIFALAACSVTWPDERACGKTLELSDEMIENIQDGYKTTHDQHKRAIRLFESNTRTCESSYINYHKVNERNEELKDIIDGMQIDPDRMIFEPLGEWEVSRFGDLI